MNKATLAMADREIERMKLREMFAKQDRPIVYTILRHVSASGMSRDISLFTIVDGEKVNLTYSVAEVIGEKVRNSHGFNAIRIGGCGMDMGFALVHSLICSLYPTDMNSTKIRQEWA